MEHDQEMHAHPDILDHHFHSVYPQDLNLYDTPPSFLNQSEASSQRFALPEDAFRSHDQHEAEHVYNSLPLALDPSALDLRSNFNHDQRPVSSRVNGSNNTTPTGSLRLTAYNPHDPASPGRVTRRRDTLEHLHLHIDTALSPDEQDTLSQQEHHDDSQHQPSDMQSIDLHAAGMRMHLDDAHGHGLMSPMGQEHGQNEDRNRTHNVC